MTDIFEARFGTKPMRSVSTPGRVNLLGEWVDFSGGLVLPMAIPHQITVSIGPNGGSEDVLVSAQFEDEGRFDLDAPASGHWSDYVRGALQIGRDTGAIEGGFNVALRSDIPHGSGLSSSAAVTVAALLCLENESSHPNLTEIAKTARLIENEFIGVPCGIMDQMAVAIAKPGEVLALETGDLSYQAIALPKNWKVSIIHSGVSRELADGRYGERRDECLRAADMLGAELLCKADLDAASHLPEPLNLRARHVISEDHRTRQAFEALLVADQKRFGDLMNEGHRSIRDDFKITVPAVDALVADAVKLGAYGARQTGGGFGGCIVALTAPDSTQDWWRALSSRHPNAHLVV